MGTNFLLPPVEGSGSACKLKLAFGGAGHRAVVVGKNGFVHTVMEDRMRQPHIDDFVNLKLQIPNKKKSKRRRKLQTDRLELSSFSAFPRCLGFGT
jgi:hypothetical protein